MESQRLYKGCSMMIQKVAWEFAGTDTEWVYVGVGDEFDRDTVQGIINSRFSETEILMVTDRRHAGPVATRDAAQAVNASLEKNDVILCDDEFQSFMFFSATGVMRQGNVKH